MAAPNGSHHRLAIIRRILTMEEVFEVAMADEHDDSDSDHERSAQPEHALCARTHTEEVEAETQVSSSTEKVCSTSDLSDVGVVPAESELEDGNKQRPLDMSRTEERAQLAEGAAEAVEVVCRCRESAAKAASDSASESQPPLSLSSQRLGRQHGGQASDVQNKPFAAALPNAQNMASTETECSESDEAVMQSDSEDNEAGEGMNENINVVDSDEEDDSSSTEAFTGRSSPLVSADADCEPNAMQEASASSSSKISASSSYSQDRVVPKWVIKDTRERRGSGGAVAVAPQASRATPSPYLPHSVTIITKEGKKMDVIVIPNMAERVNGVDADVKKYRCPIVGCKMSKVAKSRGYIEKHFNNTHHERYTSWRKLYLDKNGPGLVVRGQFDACASKHILPDSSSQEAAAGFGQDSMEEEDGSELTEEEAASSSPRAAGASPSPSTSQQLQPAITCTLTTSTRPSWTQANRPPTCSTLISTSSPLQSLSSLVNSDDVRTSSPAHADTASVESVLGDRPQSLIAPVPSTPQQHVILSTQPSVYAMAPPPGMMAAGQVPSSMMPQFSIAVSQPSPLMLPQQQQAYYSMGNPASMPIMLLPPGTGLPPDFAAQLQYPPVGLLPQHFPPPPMPPQQPQVQFQPVLPPQSPAPLPATSSSSAPVQRYKCVNVLVPEHATPAQVASGLQNLQSLPRVSLVATPMAMPSLRPQEHMSMPMAMSMPTMGPMQLPPQHGYAMISAMPAQMQLDQQPAPATTMIVPMFSVQ